MQYMHESKKMAGCVFLRWRTEIYAATPSGRLNIQTSSVEDFIAKKWLEEKEIEFEQRDIKEEKPTAEELKTWWRKSGLPLKRFFNTSGKLYKEMQLKDRIPNMSEDEQIELLASDGMLVKRPILVQNEKVLVGFKEKEWQEIL